MINIEVFRRVRSVFPPDRFPDQENSHAIHKEKWIVHRANYFADDIQGWEFYLITELLLEA